MTTSTTAAPAPPPARAEDTADGERITPARFHIVAWADAVIDDLGHDPRSLYVERFWLPVLGPTSTLLMRHLAVRFDRDPEGFDLDAASTAKALGLGTRGGRHSALNRAVARCAQFKLLQVGAPAHLVVRRKFPPLNRVQVGRLPEGLGQAHLRWQEVQRRQPSEAHLELHARRLAATLRDVGLPDAEVVEQLGRWRFASDLARRAVAWARAEGPDPMLAGGQPA